MKKCIEKVTLLTNQGVFFTKKHSPIILLVGAGVGVAATVVTGIKAGKKLDEIEGTRTAILEDTMSEIGTSDRRDPMVLDRVNELYPRRQFAWDIAKVLAPPVLMGTLTVAAATGSYTIMAKRITGLSAALAISNQEREWYKKEVRTRYGDDVFMEFEHGYENFVDENGTARVKDEDTRPTQTDCYVKFHASDLYVSDDHNLNMAQVTDCIRRLEEILSRKGHMTLNTVYDVLGFPPTAAGAALGFNDSQGPAFSVVTHDMSTRDEDNWTIQKQITIAWSQPVFIYDDVDYSSDVM